MATAAAGGSGAIGSGAVRRWCWAAQLGHPLPTQKHEIKSRSSLQMGHARISKTWN